MWQTALEQAQRTLGIPELSAARFSKGRWSFYGDPERRYPIASVTKTFTARAVELAGIDLDQPVRARLPGFRLHDPRATERMTVRDLLCHRSGLPPHTWAWVFARERRADWIVKRLPYLAHIGPHDNAYRYSNIGYAIAGALLPGDWERFLQSKVIRPLGLTKTAFLTQHWYKGGDVAPPHRGGKAVAPFVARAGHLIGPASELLSSTADLTRWIDHMRDANTDCLTSQIRMAPGTDRWYALGWRRDRTLIWHTGSCTGYSSIVAMNPARSVAMCIACNQHGVTKHLETLVRGGRVAENARAPAPSFPIPKGAAKAPQLGLTGTWRHPGYGELVIASDGSVRFHGTEAGRVRGKTWTMQPYGLDFELNQRGNTLDIPLEPKLAPIKFSKRD